MNTTTMSSLPPLFVHFYIKNQIYFPKYKVEHFPVIHNTQSNAHKGEGNYYKQRNIENKKINISKI